MQGLRLHLAVILALVLFVPSLAGAAGKDKRPVVQLIATGGTIAMKIDPVKKAPVPAISGEDLLATVPDIADIAKIEVVNVSRVPSCEMSPARWVELQKVVTAALKRSEVAGVIISHGTDTLEETAYFLDLAVKSDKPIVLIGAQRNADESDFDGPRNLRNAVRICVSPDAKNKGSMVVLNGHINAGRDVTKTHTWDVETFKSGDMGELGMADVDRVIFYRAPLRRQHVPVIMNELPKVDIIYIYGGADGDLIKAAVERGAKGIVLAALGWGNISTKAYEVVKEVLKGGTPVVVATRCWNGRVQPHYGYPGGGKTLKDAGAVFADDLTPQKARLLLMLAMQSTKDQGKLQGYFNK
ncbi:MAG: asparaginase [Deltaproteobacteria bacterium]|jgi:L-asparaginase|nr:asparaginase [Deltaproteobacteria bacterium]